MNEAPETIGILPAFTDASGRYPHMICEPGFPCSVLYRRAALEPTPPLSDPRVVALVEALRDMLQAVCGENGFLDCVPLDTRTAYPWPALDRAERYAREALAALEAAKGAGDRHKPLLMLSFDFGGEENVRQEAAKGAGE